MNVIFSTPTQKVETVETLVSLDRVFMPEELSAKVSGSEETMQAASKLFLKSAVKALCAFKNRMFTDFDPLVGDDGCERRALRVWTLAQSPKLQAEAKQVKPAVEAADKELEQRHHQLKNRKEVALKPDQFFQRKVQALKVSPEMAYMLQAYFLTVTKIVRVDFKTNLIVRTYTGAEAEVNDEKRLASVARCLENKAVREAVGVTAIMAYVKAQLAEASMQFVHHEVSKVLDSSALEHLKMMTVPYEKGKLTYRSFFGFKAILLRLREQQAFFVLKELIPAVDKVKEGQAKQEKAVPKQPMGLLFQAKEPGGAFEVVFPEKGKMAPVFVLEGAFAPGMTCQLMAGKIKNAGGLTEVVLANASLITDDPAELSPDARADMELYQAKALKMGYVKTLKDKYFAVSNPFFLMDHAYCSTMEKEFKILLGSM